jgi:hypothetical protein
MSVCITPIYRVQQGKGSTLTHCILTHCCKAFSGLEKFVLFLRQRYDQCSGVGRLQADLKAASVTRADVSFAAAWGIGRIDRIRLRCFISRLCHRPSGG